MPSMHSRCCCFSNYFTATATNMKCTAPSTCFAYSCCNVVSTFHCMCCDPVLLLIVVAVTWFYFSFQLLGLNFTKYSKLLQEKKCNHQGLNQQPNINHMTLQLAVFNH